MADEFGVNRETIRQILVEDLGVPGHSNKNFQWQTRGE